MPPRDARTAHLIARLTTAGLAPEERQFTNRTLISAHVPDAFPPEAWPDVLTALAAADEFGSSDGREGRRIWAVIRRTSQP